MGFFSKILNVFKSKSTKERENIIEDLEDILIEADIGGKFSSLIASDILKRAKELKVSDDESIRKILSDVISSYVREFDFRPSKENLNILMLLGVNGCGKTTTCAKLANTYKKEGYSVMLCAGDTFRAAAVDQLKIHADKLQVDFTEVVNAGGPGAVIYESIDKARKNNNDILLFDTAGRMHTRDDLVKELEKIDRIVKNKTDGKNYYKFIVLDGTAGQNIINQAEAFNDAVKLDALIITKLDSSSKGGAVVKLSQILDLPIAFIGTGEGYDDLKPFKKEEFIRDLIS